MNDTETPRTITLTPHWPGVRRYVRAVARTDMATAVRIAATMGTEAPSLQELADAAPVND